MLFAIVFLVIILCPFFMFSGGLEGALAGIITFAVTIPLSIYFWLLAKNTNNEEERKRLVKRKKREKKIEKEYGIIDFSDKKK